MTRMLDALKTLEGRRQTEPEQMTAPQWDAAPLFTTLDSLELELDLPTPSVQPQAATVTSPEKCALPILAEVPGQYLELASRVSRQLAANYCNVILYVAPDHAVDACFSMTHLAQAFALESAGDVLLVDGDLRTGRLSKSVCPASQGVIEAMLGTATWPDLIHQTNHPRIDFVANGKGPVPTFERPGFGWHALRPRYRAVLIGVGVAGDPEIGWLAARCDAAYFVLSRPHTKRQAASTAVNGLRASGVNLLGCVVVND